MHGTSSLVFALYIFCVTGLLLYPQLPWRIPFFLVFALYIFIFTGRLLYSQLSWRIFFCHPCLIYNLIVHFHWPSTLLSTVMAYSFLESSPFILFIFTGLSTLNCHGASFASDFFALYILFYFTVTGLLLYSQLSWHNFVSSIIYACHPPQFLIFLQILISQNRYTCFSL